MKTTVSSKLLRKLATQWIQLICNSLLAAGISTLTFKHTYVKLKDFLSHDVT